LIEAVGENVPAPADAAIVEGEGLTVYPGLVDSLSTWVWPTLPRRQAAAGGRGGRGAATPATPTGAPAAAPATPARGPEDRPATTSWLKAADEIPARRPPHSTARAAGFTTAVAFPTRGIFGRAGRHLRPDGRRNRR